MKMVGRLTMAVLAAISISALAATDLPGSSSSSAMGAGTNGWTSATNAASTNTMSSGTNAWGRSVNEAKQAGSRAADVTGDTLKRAGDATRDAVKDAGNALDRTPNP